MTYELTKQQQKTFNNFNKYNNMVVFSPRRGGKTTLAKYIVEQNKDKKIGIFTRVYDMFEKFKEYKNCELILSEESYIEKIKEKGFDILIGEEEIIPSEINIDKKISFLTPPYCVDVWNIYDNPLFLKKEIERIKKSIPKEILKSEYFIED